MDYNKIYDSVINNARSKYRSKGKGVYYEEHHILPLSLGGSQKKSNLVLLTAKEHFICHKLLVEIYPDNVKLFYAVWMMSNVRGEEFNGVIGSIEYSRLKEINSKIQSVAFKDKNNPIRNLNRKKELNPMWKHVWEKESTDKISQGVKEFYKNNPENLLKLGLKKEKHPHWGKTGDDAPFGGHNHTVESKSMISVSLKGKYIGELSSQFGVIKDAEIIERQKLTWKNKPKLKCSYCGLIGTSTSNMRRYHFDNCKLKPNE